MQLLRRENVAVADITQWTGVNTFVMVPCRISLLWEDAYQSRRLRTSVFYARMLPEESDTRCCNAISREIDMVIFPREALTTLPRFQPPPSAVVNTFLSFG